MGTRHVIVNTGAATWQTQKYTVYMTPDTNTETQNLGPNSQCIFVFALWRHQY